MARHQENRKIPDLVISNMNDETPFESSTSLETENYTCFGITKQNTRALSLKVTFDNGGVVLIQYGRMMAPIMFNGSNEIKITTPMMQLVIKGRSLSPLMDFLAENRLAWIKSSRSGGLSDSIMMVKGEPEIQDMKAQFKSNKKEQEE